MTQRRRDNAVTETAWSCGHTSSTWVRGRQLLAAQRTRVLLMAAPAPPQTHIETAARGANAGLAVTNCKAVHRTLHDSLL